MTIDRFRNGIYSFNFNDQFILFKVTVDLVPILTPRIYIHLLVHRAI